MSDDIQMAVIQTSRHVYDPKLSYQKDDGCWVRYYHVPQRYVTGVDINGRITGWTGDDRYADAMIFDKETAEWALSLLTFEEKIKVKPRLLILGDQ